MRRVYNFTYAACLNGVDVTWRQLFNIGTRVVKKSHVKSLLNRLGWYWCSDIGCELPRTCDPVDVCLDDLRRSSIMVYLLHLFVNQLYSALDSTLRHQTNYISEALMHELQKIINLDWVIYQACTYYTAFVHFEHSSRFFDLF